MNTICGSFRFGERIYLPGGSGEPSAAVAAVLGAPDVDVTTTFVPGVNRLLPEMIGERSRVTGPFMHAALAQAQRDGRFRQLPGSYATMLKYLRESDPIDTCVIQVAPPDKAGDCSLGPAAEFTPEVLRRARRVIAVVNVNVPRLRHAPRIALATCSQVIEAATPLIRYDVGEPVDETTLRIARRVADFAEDGAAVQVGLGKVPHAILQALAGRSGLRLHSGMLSDGVIALAAAGALDPVWEHTTTAVLGSEALYDWLATRDDIHVRGVEWTHDPRRLVQLDHFVAINSALEVDLFGQCNLEWAGGRAVSGAGGAPDFARGARLAQNGISIVALPATFGGNAGSRIKPILGETAIVSLSRVDVDVVVTEYGAADLRGLSVHERAVALIGVADPGHRPGLEQAWRSIAARL